MACEGEGGGGGAAAAAAGRWSSTARREHAADVRSSSTRVVGASRLAAGEEGDGPAVAVRRPLQQQAAADSAGE
eukprot:990585-Prymnesium_polylepis.1